MWVDAKRVDASVMWWSFAIMFCLSLVPYATNFAGTNFNSSVAQGFYGIVILSSTAFYLVLNQMLGRANADVEGFTDMMNRYCRVLALDCGIKLVSLLLAVLVWPPAMMWGVLVAELFIYWRRASWKM